MHYLCTRISRNAPKENFGVWCNGNTADSGPAFPGSSPGTPTKLNRKLLEIKHLRFLFFNDIVFYTKPLSRHFPDRQRRMRMMPRMFSSRAKPTHIPTRP